MLSATLPNSIQQLASFYLNKNYIFLAMGIVSSASQDIKQHFHQVNRYNKLLTLTSILKEGLYIIHDCSELFINFFFTNSYVL